MKKRIKKIMSAILCATMMIPALPAKEANAQTAYTDVVSRADEQGIALSMGVFADSQYSGNVDHIKKALDVFNTIDPDYDAITMVGDITYMQGFLSSATFASVEAAKEAMKSVEKIENVHGTYLVKADAQYQLLKDALSEKAQGKPYIYVMGNHEFPLNSNNMADATSAGYVEEASKQIFQEMMYPSASSVEDAVYRDEVVQGYHFISASPMNYSNKLGENGEAYVKEKINAALAETDGETKPIFVVLHRPIQETTIGSGTGTSCYSAEFKQFLQEHPQVVVLVGHTHYASNDPQKIWQDGFTQIDVGCTGGSMGLRTGTYDSGIAADWIEANYIEVTTDNVVYVHRISVQSGTASGQTPKYIGNPYVLDIPAMVADANDGGEVNTDVWKYTDARRTNAVAPAFADTDKITVTALTSNSATIQFPSATIATEDEEVVSYRIQVINKRTSQQTQDYLVSSDYYATNKKTAFTETISGLGSSTEYSIKVSAVSPWNKESKPIAVDVKTTASTSGAVTPDNTGVTVKKLVSESTSSTVADGSKWASGADNTSGWGMGPSQKVVYTFTVPEDGKYELFTTAGVGSGGGSLTAKIAEKTDNIGSQSTTIVVPTGKIDTKNRISAGSYHLRKDASYTITFTKDAGSATVQMWNAMLVKTNDAIIKVVEAKDDCLSYSTNTGHNTEGKRLSFWGKAEANYSVEIPKAGTYDVYLWQGTSAAQVTWKATVGNKSVSNSLAGTGSYGTYGYEKLGSLELTSGTFSLKMEGTYPSSTFSLRRVVLVQENAFIYQIEQYPFDSVGTTGGTPSWSEEYPKEAYYFWNGSITFNITPELTGVYDLIWQTVGSQAEGTTYVDGVQIDNRQYSMSGQTEHNIAEVRMTAGQTYTIKIADSGGSNALGIQRLLLNYNRAITLEDGICMNIYVGDRVGGNVTPYGDGRAGNPGTGMDTTHCIDFDIEITEAGLYNVAAKIACNDDSTVSIYADGTMVGEQPTSVSKTADYNSPEMIECGSVVLQKGTHRFQVRVPAGSIHFYQLQLTSVRGLNDSDSFVVFRDAISYDAVGKGGDYSESSAGIVMGTAGNYTEYIVDVPAGNYALTINFACKTRAGNLRLSVDGEAVGNFDLPAIGQWLANYQAKSLGILSLDEGTHTIRIQRGTYYFTYGSIRLEKIEEAVSELYRGSYIVTDTGLAQTFTGSAAGEMIVRTYLPTNMKDKYVQLVAGIYDTATGGLVRTVFSKPAYADSNSVVVTSFEDASQALARTTGTYTWEVDAFEQYSLEHAAVADGSAGAEGTLPIEATTAESVFASDFIFSNEGASITYRGMTVALQGDNLYVTGLGETFIIEPTQFGFKTFKNQGFELQLTTNGIGEGTRVGIWVDQKLANGSYYSADLTEWNANVSFTDGVERFGRWRIAAPSTEDTTYVELVNDEPYVVTADEFKGADGKEYVAGDRVFAAGQYTAKSGVQTENITLWRRYDLRADDAFDARDLVALKKYVADPIANKPATNAGQMAESCLTSAYEIFRIRQELARQ